MALATMVWNGLQHDMHRAMPVIVLPPGAKRGITLTATLVNQWEQSLLGLNSWKWERKTNRYYKQFLGCRMCLFHRGDRWRYVYQYAGEADPTFSMGGYVDLDDCLRKLVYTLCDQYRRAVV